LTEVALPELIQLKKALGEVPRRVVAVSGGVDSMTLGMVAHREVPGRTVITHAISPAVSFTATLRVKEHALRENWDLRLIDAGEMADKNYLKNPLNRCFFCKSNLYGTIASCSEDDHTILSGTNTDDLTDFRPGLLAAKDFGVRHPYVEAHIDKAAVRRIAHSLGLTDIAELPASPCLSSRIETNIVIDSETLRAIDAAETHIRQRFSGSTIRCRVRHDAIVVELDSRIANTLDTDSQNEIVEIASSFFREIYPSRSVRIQPYSQGSAFLQEARL
jgi:pyridinium-3,5-biscarboxylic acid mononucleotide sulfurtransferase